jgi:hypothetical protein
MVTNFIYLSPQFPTNYIAFVQNLKKFGVRVLGIGSDPYHALPAHLKSALTEYCYLPEMDDCEQVLEAGHYFQSKFGEIDRVESHTEYWLPYEAALRDELNVWGKRQADLPLVKQKSRMKEVFRRAGIAVARGILVDSPEAARAFAALTGYPVVAKPNAGVGAFATYRLNNDAELEAFLSHRPPVEYFLEEFVEGVIQSFDGLVSRSGEILYCNSIQYTEGIMEVVNSDHHLAYWTAREIAPDLEDAGRRAVKAFDIRERFFHIEFFRKKSGGDLVGLEVNIRPPGGLTTDMWNYGDDIDLYFAWARMVAEDAFDLKWSRKYHVGFIGRKDGVPYAQSHDQLMRRCGAALMHWQRMPQLFSQVMGETGYIVRTPSFDELEELIAFGHEARMQALGPKD